jgi:hypothetical protein
MGQKLLTMSKMTRSCHDIVMWANVHPLCLYTTAISGITKCCWLIYALIALDFLRISIMLE